MSRLRVRNTANTKWIDICQSEWYVRNASNTGWERFTPNQGIKAWHGTESYWLDINCLSERADCEADEYGGTTDGKGSNGSGTGNGSGGVSPGDGSDSGGDGDGGGTGLGGNNNTDSPYYNNPDKGNGRGGSGWSEGAPYPGGFDLPDSDGPGAGWNGGCFQRPGLGTCEPPTSLIVRDDIACSNGKAPGSFDCPFKCPEVVMGAGAGIAEFYIDLGTVSGTVILPWSVSPGAASFDVYYRGKIMATTEGKRGGVDALSFVFTPEKNETKLFVRVRATTATTRWTFQLKCVGDTDTDGNINDPRPCKGTYEPKQQGGVGVYEFFHNLGTVAGVADIHYQMWTQPDKLEVFNNQGKRIHSTNGFVVGEGHLKVNHVPGGDNLVRVRVVAQEATTAWVYMITCPNQKGAEDDPRPCDDTSTVTSGGAGVTDTYVNFGDKAGEIGVRYQMYNIPDKLDVYQNGTLIATTGGPVTGDHWLYFAYDPARGRNCQIRVTGSGKTSWSFLHTCPQDKPTDISIDNPSVQEGDAGESKSICWTVTLSEEQLSPLTVDYRTSNGTASSSDYVAVNGTLTFAPGETSKRICTTLVGNNAVDGDRTIIMTLSNASKGTIKDAVGVGTILDDDSLLCKQRPTEPVYEYTGGPDGAYMLHVQPVMECAKGDTKYLMQAFLPFPETGSYVFNTLNDDEFELYIDCKLVAEGPIGGKMSTVRVSKGTRNVILRYKNIPDCTPGNAGFSIRYNNQLIYLTRAADWKGQANSIGEIE